MPPIISSNKPALHVYVEEAYTAASHDVGHANVEYHHSRVDYMSALKLSV